MADVAATIASVATSLTPGLGVVTAGIKLADDSLSLIAQPIKSAQLDKPINEAQDRIQLYEDILSEKDPAVRAARFGPFAVGLCVDSGFAPGQFSGGTERVPLECLNSFVLATIALIRLLEQERADNAAKTVSK